jgi:hypothetical protein
LAEPVSIETSGNGWDEDEVARGVSGTEIFGSLALPCVDHGVRKVRHELRGFLDGRNAEREACPSLAPVDRVPGIVAIKQQS